MNQRYKIEKSLGRGGMGEVFLAYDTEAKRHVAIKKIRDDLKGNDQIKKRFLREAKISSTLCHPSIIPIYDINLEEPYYTMPYVEGKNLKEIIKTTKFEPTHPIGSSIPTMIRFFLNVCEAVAYIHSKNILHRDLKPDNIIIGRFGEVLILDWGIAKFIDENELYDTLCISKEDQELTQIGKTAGTITYMSPERVLGKPASILSDIYSLGVILYQILTLDTPFKRRDAKTLKKTMHLEKIISPIEKAPYRDIPQKLSDICMKCLSPKEDQRYQNVEDLIGDLKDYIDGKAEWILTANLDINNKNDWQFNENIFHAKHSAISIDLDFSNWMTLMVSNLEFSNNIRIEADVSLLKNSEGIGFLFNLLKKQKKFSIDEGYNIWLNLNKKDTQITRSNVLIFNEKINIAPDEFNHITIEKAEDKLNFYLNKELIFSHINHLPLRGNFFAIAYQDTFFKIENLRIYTSSYNLMVNCLAIADAFYAKEEYDSAIKEYQKIAFSFPGRKEALEAIFRTGISLLGKSKTIKSKSKKNQLFDLTLDEFQKLHSTAYGPLEYLGKSLVYLEKNDFEEEAKCLELMIRKFFKHHLKPIIKEYIIYRMIQSSEQNREAALRIILIALRFLPNIFLNIDLKNLIESLNKNIENIYFIENSTDFIPCLSIKLAYMLNKPGTLIEILQKPYLDEINIENAIFSLLELNELEKASIELEKNKEKLSIKSYELIKMLLNQPYEKILYLFLSEIRKEPSFNETRILIFILEKLIENKKHKVILDCHEILSKLHFDKEHKILIDSELIRSYLLENFFPQAAEILNQYPDEEKIYANSPLYFLFGILLYHEEGLEIAKTFFSGVEDNFHPFSNCLFSYYITSQNKNILRKAFHFEKKHLTKDIFLFKKIQKSLKKT
ncbi:MAG: protein kinase [Parachlamydiales bacterium]|jgi:serine/threonine-protein kinase